MYELTTLNVYTAADNGLISFAAEPVEKPDARFICVRLRIVSRHWKVNAFQWTDLTPCRPRPNQALQLTAQTALFFPGRS